MRTFRYAGASVLILSAVGKGCPDLLVGWRGENLLVECKTKRGTLTPDQKRFFLCWRGNVAVVRNPLEAVELLNEGGKRCM